MCRRGVLRRCIVKEAHKARDVCAGERAFGKVGCAEFFSDDSLEECDDFAQVVFAVCLCVNGELHA